MTELKNLLEALLGSYISGFQVDGRIPYLLLEIFERDMEKTSKNLSLELSEKYQSALNSGNTPEEAMAAVRWDGVGGFLDWLTLGIVSGVWDGIEHRQNPMTDAPSFKHRFSGNTRYDAGGAVSHYVEIEITK